EQVAAHAGGDLGRAEADEPPQRGEQRVPLAPRVAPDRIEHDVHARGGKAAYGVRPPRVTAVERLDAIGPQHVVFPGRREADDPEPEDATQLRDGESHAARGGM